jgi:DNA-binding XRE family transcriptional regulator
MEKEMTEFYFAAELIEWCQANGVRDHQQMATLFQLINKYYTRKDGRFDIPDRPNNYRTLREERGELAKDVAAAVGLSKEYYSMVENGKVKKPRRQVIAALDKYFGL